MAGKLPAEILHQRRDRQNESDNDQNPDDPHSAQVPAVHHAVHHLKSFLVNDAWFTPAMPPGIAGSGSAFLAQLFGLMLVST